MGNIVTVWIQSQGVQFLVGQFQAKKVEESNWDSFSQSVLQRKENITRENYIKESFSHPEMKRTAQLLSEGKKINGDHWKHLMKTYLWKLTINDKYELKDYLASYLNGEQLYIYAGENQLEKARPAPYELEVYFYGNGHGLQHFSLRFDKKEILEGFMKMALTAPMDSPIDFHLEISDDLKQLTAFLIKGNTKIELHKIKGSRERLYYN